MIHLRSKRIRGRATIWCASVALLLALRGMGHDSPEHVIEQLTARMAATGTNAEALWERATEYRALGRVNSACRDLRHAARLRPDLLPVLADLALVEQACGKSSLALATLERALGQCPDEAARGGLYMKRAEIYQAQGEFAKALADCERAFRLTPVQEPDWYLTRSQLQARSGRLEEAAKSLQHGYELTGHAVLEAEWIDALLDAGQFQSALERIEPRLAESRCQSSWLLRRARARLGLGQVAPARGDLNAAVTEINARLNPVQAEPTLLAERGFASALLGDREVAREDLKIARERGAEAGLVYRLEKAVGEDGRLPSATREVSGSLPSNPNGIP